MRRINILVAVSLLAMAGCTNFVTVDHAGGNWEQARLATQQRGTPAPTRTTTSTSAPAALDWGQPTSGEGALDPKPLPPLRTSGASAPIRDTPVVETEPAPPARIVMSTPLEAESAAVVRPSPTPATAPKPEPTREPVVASTERPSVAPEPRPAAPATLEEPASRLARAAAPVDEALTPPALSGVGFLWPVPNASDGTVVAETAGEGGLVIDVDHDEPFVAAENGVVVFAADAMEPFGNMVVVRHDGDYTTSYAHAASLDVEVGEVVRRGQRLGTAGQSGAASDPRLYFEMRVGSRVVDPRAYLVGAPRLAAR